MALFRRLAAPSAHLRRLALLTHLALLLGGGLGFATASLHAEEHPISAEERERGYRDRMLLAKPLAAASAGAIAQFEGTLGLKLVREHARFGGLRVLESDGGKDVKIIVRELVDSGLYEYAEPDYIRRATVVPNDARFETDQWSLNNTGQAGGVAGADIKAAAAWEIQREAPDVIVAVMDTGVRLIHEDIRDNLWRNPGETGARPALDDDANGYIDDLHGIDATVAKNSFLAGDPSDQDGHGSHVAGIIGAVGNNGVGISGVAWKVQIMPLKFLGRNGGTVAQEIVCIDYAIAKGVKIINASFGSLAYSQSEYDAIKRARDAGIIFVAAAGNDSQEINEVPEYPAAYALDNIIAVASTTRQDRLASYSTYGSGLVDLAAPGSSILSLGTSQNAPYVALSGTSMAAPHVSGALALLRQRFPGETPRQLINRLLSNVDVLPALENRVHTNGRLNLQRALSSTDTRPFNDDFARRATLTGDFNSARASTDSATREAGEPDHGVPASTGSVWWNWTAPDIAGKATFDTLGSAIDTVVAVYRVTGASPTLGSLQRVAFSDDDGSATTSSVTFDTTPGTVYAIAVSGKAGAPGLVMLNVTTVPANDAFASARLLSGSSVVLEVNNSRATSETGEPKTALASGATTGRDRSLWFKWVAPASRPYQISAVTKSTDPLLTIYTGSSLATLSQLTFDDNSGPYYDSLIRLNATAGVTYYIKADTGVLSTSGGRMRLSISDAAWQYVSDDPIDASPAIGADGTIYAADVYGFVYALNPNGTRKWLSSVTGYVYGGAIALGSDGTLYTGDDFGYLHALSPANGARKWRFQTNDFIWSAPAIAADGTIYVKSDDGQLYAINSDGTRKWAVAVPGDTYSAPTIAADGTIYIASSGATALYALDPADGARKWRFELGAAVYASPALGADGTIYLGNYDGLFFAIRPDGTERWRFNSGSALSGSAVIDARGYVYFGSYDKKLYALDAATGAKRWDYATGDIIRSTAPLIADDGTIYIGSDDGYVHALDGDGKLLRTYATSAPILSTPMLNAGRLYVGSGDGKLYAFDTGNNVARNAPWPMHRHNLRRTARPTELAGVPTFATQPSARANVPAGSSVTLSATATVADASAITYQWYLNDIAISGATSANYTMSSVQGINGGTYRVVATGTGGATISRATELVVQANTDTSGRLINLAVRTTAGRDPNQLFVGFVVGPLNFTGNKPLLIRGVGPMLGTFGVFGVLPDPRLQFYNGSRLIAENEDWNSAANAAEVANVAARVGAFALLPTTKDAALYTTPAPGNYSAQISTTTSDTGIVLAEIYDATPADQYTATTPRLINVSARTHVGTGSNVLIAGFVIGGTGTKTILVRAVGPTMGSLFGVPGVLANPRLDLFRGNEPTPISSNDDWGTASNAAQVTAASSAVGAFALPLESRDAVLLLTLPPGQYSAQVSGVGGTTGGALVEVYEVP